MVGDSSNDPPARVPGESSNIFKRITSVDGNLAAANPFQSVATYKVEETLCFFSHDENFLVLTSRKVRAWVGVHRGAVVPHLFFDGYLAVRQEFLRDPGLKSVLVFVF